jgi:hypothetical protein
MISAAAPPEPLLLLTGVGLMVGTELGLLRVGDGLGDGEGWCLPWGFFLGTGTRGGADVDAEGVGEG